MADPHTTSHQIACKAAKQIVQDGEAAGLDWTDIVISCETVIAIVVAAVVEISASGADPHRLATELIDTMTERAHGRVAALLLGVPYDG